MILIRPCWGVSGLVLVKAGNYSEAGKIGLQRVRLVLSFLIPLTDTMRDFGNTGHQLSKVMVRRKPLLVWLAPSSSTVLGLER